MHKKKSIILVGLLAFLLLGAIFSNPTTQDYLRFSEAQIGQPTPSSVEIERLNFYLFSTYAPKGPMDHYGIVHLGFMGNFFQISEGQFDYPWWLEYFN